MPTILNIESSASACSVALSVDGSIEFSAEEREAMHQSTHLAPFVAKAMEEVSRRDFKLDAVAVSIGPGSYTGLRIGLSLAKGLAFSLDVPLIGVNTLELIAVKAMFRSMDWQGNEILVPMVDARRMEVYTAAYNFRLDALMEPCAKIIEPDSFETLAPGLPIYIMGDGAAKTKDVIKRPDTHWIDGIIPLAKDMTALSERAFRNQDFLDVAYSTPYYIKNYDAVVGANPLSKLLG